ncbi:MAG: hypothetical protein EO766_17835 [Hydrotalea sp. AMD]|uniref:hypothetical protein n=1 Tax=Hydrotalea sp. AMD TaxID=2501297 RepID=UPI001024C983|nr:hypothetical protein [Hydrotalea sp. AMD]RWZ83180.1 MAG: hypothetical protein EO766_17835 [Hydrotalea sp. AMD]
MAYDLYVPTYPIKINDFSINPNLAYEGLTLDNGYYATAGGTNPAVLYQIGYNSNQGTIKLDHVNYNSSNTNGFKPLSNKAPILVYGNEIYTLFNGKMWVFNNQGKTIRVSPQLPATIPNLENGSLLLSPVVAFPRIDESGNAVCFVAYPSPSSYFSSPAGYTKNYLVCKEYSFSNFNLLRTYVVYFNDKILYPTPSSGTFTFDFSFIGKRVFAFLRYTLSGILQPTLDGDFGVPLDQTQTTVSSRKSEGNIQSYFYSNNFYQLWTSATSPSQNDSNIQSKNYSSGNALQLVSYAPNPNYWALVNNATQDPYLYIKGINTSLLIPKSFLDVVTNTNVTVPSGTFSATIYNDNLRAGALWKYTSANKNYLFVPFIGKVNYTFPITNYTLGKEFK